MRRLAFTRPVWIEVAHGIGSLCQPKLVHTAGIRSPLGTLKFDDAYMKTNLEAHARLASFSPIITKSWSQMIAYAVLIVSKDAMASRSRES